METYSVKEIAEMLNTNPETVRRWIRDKKLEASIESKRCGHIVYESALREFLRASPKYAAIAKTSLADVAENAVLPTVIIGCMIAQRLIDSEQLKKARISNDDIINSLRNEIRKCTEAVKAKEDTVRQLQMQIETDQSLITEFQKLIDCLSAEEIDCLSAGEDTK